MTMISKLSLRCKCMNSSSEDGQQVFQITFRTHKDIHSIHKHKDIHSILCTPSRDQPLDQLLVQQLAQQISCHNIHRTTSKDQPLDQHLVRMLVHLLQVQQTSCHSKHMDIHNIQHDHKHKDNIPHITSRDQLWDQPLV